MRRRLTDASIKRKAPARGTLELWDTVARDAARQIMKDASRGIDSASREAKREAARKAQIERERNTANSFRAVVESYLEDPGKHGVPCETQPRLVRGSFVSTRFRTTSEISHYV